MKIWIDAQLSPAMAKWIEVRFAIAAVPVRDLGLRDATDIVIFRAAREADAIVLTKRCRLPTVTIPARSPAESALADLRQHLECGAPGDPRPDTSRSFGTA